MDAQMERADFYVGMGPEAKWLGSVSRCGEIWQVPLSLLIQVNQTMYEEAVAEYIDYCQGIQGNHVCMWPWDWADSRMTEYSYMYIPQHEKIYMSILGGDLLDPIKIQQGRSLIEANTLLGPPIFPLMVDLVSYEEEYINGQKPTVII
jgi:hypothetical protein